MSVLSEKVKSEKLVSENIKRYLNEIVNKYNVVLDLDYWRSSRESKEDCPWSFVASIESLLRNQCDMIIDRKLSENSKVTFCCMVRRPIEKQTSWFFTKSEAILQMLTLVPQNTALSVLAKLHIYPQIEIAPETRVNNLIYEMCSEHRVYPQLVPQEWSPNLYTLDEKTWNWIDNYNEDNYRVETWTYLETLSYILNSWSEKDWKNFSDYINPVIEKDNIEDTDVENDNESNTEDIKEVDQAIEGDMRHLYYTYGEIKQKCRKATNYTYEPLIQEMINRMLSCTNLPKVLFDNNDTTEPFIEDDSLIFIKKEYVDNIMIPHIISYITGKKPSSEKYRNTLKEFEDKYLLTSLEERYNKTLTEIPDNVFIYEVIEDMKVNRKIYKCSTSSWKYVPHYLSNQKVYQDQFKDNKGIHYTKEEMIGLLKDNLNKIKTGNWIDKEVESTYPESTYPESTYPESTYPESTYPESTYQQELRCKAYTCDEMKNKELNKKGEPQYKEDIPVKYTRVKRVVYDKFIENFKNKVSGLYRKETESGNLNNTSTFDTYVQVWSPNLSDWINQVMDKVDELSVISGTVGYHETVTLKLTYNTITYTSMGDNVLEALMIMYNKYVGYEDIFNCN